MSSPGQFGPSAPPPKRSGGSSVLVIILIISGVLLLACAGICGGCLFVMQRTASQVQQIAIEAGRVTELEPMQHAALSALHADQPIVDKLGEPIKIVSLPMREASGELKASEDFHFFVEGPKSSATVKCSAVKDAGAWRLTVITVLCFDGSVLTVPPPAATAPELQFDLPDAATK